MESSGFPVEKGKNPTDGLVGLGWLVHVLI